MREHCAGGRLSPSLWCREREEVEIVQTSTLIWKVFPACDGWEREQVRNTFSFPIWGLMCKITAVERQIMCRSGWLASPAGGNKILMITLFSVHHTRRYCESEGAPPPPPTPLMSRMLHAVVWVVFLSNNFLFPPDYQIQIQDIGGSLTVLQTETSQSPSLDLWATWDVFFSSPHY